MPSMTLAIKPELKKRMARHPLVRWSAVARAAIEAQIDDWETADQIAAQSRFSEKDAREFGGRTDRAMTKHFEALAHASRR